MADSPGAALQRALRRHLVAALGRVRDELDSRGLLKGLGPAGPEWQGTGLEGRLRAPLKGVSVEDPLAATVLRTLLNLATEDTGGLCRSR